MTFASRIDAENAVTDFFADYFNLSSERIKPETRIVRDLGVAGDDGDDLLSAFESRFGITASEYIGWHEFGGEYGPDPISLIILIVDLLKGRRRRAHRAPVVVSDFVDAAYVGKWIDGVTVTGLR